MFAYLMGYLWETTKDGGAEKAWWLFTEWDAREIGNKKLMIFLWMIFNVLQEDNNIFAKYLWRRITA